MRGLSLCSIYPHEDSDTQYGEAYETESHLNVGHGGDELSREGEVANLGPHLVDGDGDQSGSKGASAHG